MLAAQGVVGGAYDLVVSGNTTQIDDNYFHGKLHPPLSLMSEQVLSACGLSPLFS